MESRARRRVELLARCESERSELIAHGRALREFAAASRTTRRAADVVARHPAAVLAGAAALLLLARVRGLHGWIGGISVALPLVARLVQAARSRTTDRTGARPII